MFKSPRRGARNQARVLFGAQECDLWWYIDPKSCTRTPRLPRPQGRGGQDSSVLKTPLHGVFDVKSFARDRFGTCVAPTSVGTRPPPPLARRRHVTINVSLLDPEPTPLGSPCCLDTLGLVGSSRGTFTGPLLRLPHSTLTSPPPASDLCPSPSHHDRNSPPTTPHPTAPYRNGTDKRLGFVVGSSLCPRLTLLGCPKGTSGSRTGVELLHPTVLPPSARHPTPESSQVESEGTGRTDQKWPLKAVYCRGESLGGVYPNLLYDGWSRRHTTVVFCLRVQCYQCRRRDGPEGVGVGRWGSHSALDFHGTTHPYLPSNYREGCRDSKGPRGTQ